MHKHKVIHSFDLDDGMRCVDVFMRTDGSFGFEGYRRDPEDRRGWYPIGVFSAHTYKSSADALAEAKHRIGWLANAITARATR